ncbi:MAG: hypothetical protein LBU66_06940 [Treponema sp.]|jgi:hypothetical protein|nr:hypothetical protein [Treponema sp.]
MNKIFIYKSIWAFILVVLLFLNSCIGISMDIQMRKDGSGKAVIEYTVSNMAETIGRLDGNEKWHIIPAGRADWERTAARIPGMKLASYSSRENSRNNARVITVTVEFANTDALVKFIDASGAKVSISRENQSNKLGIILNEPTHEEIDADLLDLFKQISASFTISISFSSGANSTLTVTDGAGNEIQASSVMRLVSSGRKVSFAINTAEAATMKNGIGVGITW